MAWIIAAALLVVGFLAKTALVLYIVTPKKPLVVLQRWPALAWIMSQAVVSIFVKGTSNKQRLSKQKIEVALARPVPLDQHKLAQFKTLVGYKPSSTADEQEVPLMYPVVEAFRLIMTSMLIPQFPLNVLGSVLARCTTETYRAISPDERLLYRCTVDPSFRTTPKGDTEVDIIASATAEGDARVVWKSTVTTVVLSRNRKKGKAPAEQAQADAAPRREVIDEWLLTDDVGRKYASLNGDWNPIHLHAITSQLFGFKRPIAHALFLVARAEASLRNNGVLPVYPSVFYTVFKRPTLLPAKLQCAWEPVADVVEAIKSQQGLGVAVLTADGQKEVIVGRLMSKLA